MAVGRDVRPLLPILVVVALIGAGLLAAAFGNPSIEALPGQLAPTTGAPAPRETVIVETAASVSPPEEQRARAPNRSTLPPVLIFAAVLALVAATFLVAWLRRGRTPAIQLTELIRPAATEHVRRLLWGAVDQGLDVLAESDADPRSSVIACWSRLEAIATEAGTPRGPGDTSTDLVIRLLRAHRVSAEVLADFAGVYRQARFASHVVDDAMRRQAQAALRQLRAEMAAGVAAEVSR
jgi:hypothetical protein